MNILYINALHVDSYQSCIAYYQFPNLINIIITANFIVNDEFKTHGLISNPVPLQSQWRFEIFRKTRINVFSWHTRTSTTRGSIHCICRRMKILLTVHATSLTRIRAISTRTWNFLTSGRLLTNLSLANRSRTIGKQQAVDSEFSVSLESASLNDSTETRKVERRRKKKKREKEKKETERN